MKMEGERQKMTEMESMSDAMNVLMTSSSIYKRFRKNKLVVLKLITCIHVPAYNISSIAV